MTIIGIDLGTTNSACAIWREGKVEFIPNRLGQFLTPSVVALDDAGHLIVGQAAKDRLISHNATSVAVFKRLMGSDHKIKLGKQVFSAVELSALVVKSLKEDAEHFLGEPVDTAVISVPAYFNDNQRQATRTAGELVGLKVNRLINEPTAAAMAYGLHDRKEGTYIILDMGGGTFDVSILEFFDGVMEVHASAGDNFLGGEDFTAVLLKDLAEEFKLNLEQLPAGQQQQLYLQVENLKRRLDKAPFDWSFNLAGQDYPKTISEDWFNKLATPLMLRVKHPIERALRDANLHSNAIDEVVLVGGATRMKLFRNTLGRMFGRIPSCSLDPDLVVAMGAAIQAGLIAQDSALDDVVLTDVCPYTLGTDVVGPDNVDGYFLPIIERNSVVPISVVRRLFTVADNQTKILVKIYQGENRRVEKNIYLGELTVAVPKNDAGKEAADVRYTYDMNGLLEVDVAVVSTGKNHNLIVEQTPGALTADEKQKSLQRLARLKFHPRDQAENQALIALGDRLFAASLGERRDLIGKLLGEFDSVLEKQNPADILKSREKISGILQSMDEQEWPE